MTDRLAGGTATAEALSCISTSCGCRFQFTFIGTFFKSLEMVSMLSVVDVGAGAGTGEDVSIVRENILESVFRRCRCVCPPAFVYSGSENGLNSGPAILVLYCSPASLPSISNASCIGHLISHGTPSLYTFSSFSIILQRCHPSAYKPPAL